MFNEIFAELARRAGKPRRLTMIDVAHLKVYSIAASLLKVGLFPDATAHQRWPELKIAHCV